ncbi:MAG: ceramide glucosyltransferase [Candidatus Binatia bacterium]|nr:MAG: ceramide glucosyltransferase [Candidatus Binatia bacterium]
MIEFDGSSLLRSLVWLGMGVSAWFWLMSLYGARDFFRRRKEREAEWCPPVTVLKPLKGVDPELRENLESFFLQDYPAFQIVFGVADAADPAVAIVRELLSRYPGVDAELVVDPRLHGTNFKVSNLINMVPHVRHPVVALSDSDIRVPRDYLRRLVRPLEDRRVGLVSCLYRARPLGGTPSLLEALFINTDFCPQVLVARKVERPTYAFGASMALRRSTLEEVGGFEALADVLADDYELGNRVASRGYDLELADCLVETVIQARSWKKLYDHQMRWARTYRTCRPKGYFGTILTHGTLWSLSNLLLPGTGGFGWIVSGTCLALRAWTAKVLAERYLGWKMGLRELVWLFPKDLFLSAIWVGSFFGRTVRWSGHRFRVLRSGRMVWLGPEEELAPRTLYPEGLRP